MMKRFAMSVYEHNPALWRCLLVSNLHRIDIYFLFIYILFFSGYLQILKLSIVSMTIFFPVD